jgi:hypothetical protein
LVFAWSVSKRRNEYGRLEMSDEDSIQNKILSVIQNFSQIVRFLDYDRLQYFSEEDTKVKLVLPLIGAFGWDPMDIQMEVEFYEPQFVNKSIVDILLWKDNRQYMLLETKKLDSDLPNPENSLQAQLLLKYAASQKDVQYLVFTNFLNMSVYDPHSGKKVDEYSDPSQYVTRLPDLMRIFKRTEEHMSPYLGRELPCFGTYNKNKTECLDCNYLKPIAVICKAISSLKEQGFLTAHSP